MNRLTQVIALVTCIAFAACEKGQYHTGSAALDAALTGGQAQLMGQVIVAATKIAAGEDAKKVLVQASGDALRSLEGVALGSVQPAVTERLLAWVPRTPEWQDYAHNLGKSIHTFVANHGNTPSALQTALEAAAMALNTY